MARIRKNSPRPIWGQSRRSPQVLDLRGVVVPVAAIFGLVALEMMALSHGINGTLLKTVMVAIGVIGGFKLRELFK